MLGSYQAEFRRFFQEARSPIWQPARSYSDGDSELNKYGTLDLSGFSALEVTMYTLIQARLASKYELETVYTLDEALKLYAFYRMDHDIEIARAEEINAQQRK